jgi:Family of unknown function (DUF5946)
MVPLHAELVPCVGCGGLVPAMDGPTHRYMESSPGCWAIFGEVLAREYSDPAYAALHRQTVDAFAVQHPGQPSLQSIRSVGLHLVRLCLVLERGFSDAAAGEAMPIISQGKMEFHWLTPPAAMGPITALDVRKAKTPEDHLHAVAAWARSAWQAWAPHHAQVRSWVPRELDSRL